jgi:hypothetical protein
MKCQTRFFFYKGLISYLLDNCSCSLLIDFPFETNVIVFVRKLIDCVVTEDTGLPVVQDRVDGVEVDGDRGRSKADLIVG